MMLKLVVNNEIEEEKLPTPVSKTKGKGPTGEDWLSGMLCGTEFLVKPRMMQTWVLHEFMHAGLKEGNVLLIPHGKINIPGEWVWTDPIEFCKVFELRAILEVPKDDD